MNDTPETDAQDVIYPRTNGSKFLEPWVRSEFARKLERERNNAENQLELMTCKAAGWQNQATIEAKALVECWEKAERYRLEANAMMAQRDEAQRKVAELQAGLDDIEEYGTEEINAAVDLRHQLAAALCELSALRKEVNISAADVAVLKRRCDALKAERDAANEELEWLRKDSEQGEPQPLRAGEPSDFEGAIRRMRDAERERDQARRELDIQLESITFHMERNPVRDHPLRADDAKLEMTQKESND